MRKGVKGYTFIARVLILPVISIPIANGIKAESFMLKVEQKRVFQQFLCQKGRVRVS